MAALGGFAALPPKKSAEEESSKTTVVDRWSSSIESLMDEQVLLFLVILRHELGELDPALLCEGQALMRGSDNFSFFSFLAASVAPFRPITTASATLRRWLAGGAAARG